VHAKFSAAHSILQSLFEQQIGSNPRRSICEIELLFTKTNKFMPPRSPIGSLLIHLPVVLL
jgi:hypothetical protein